MNSADAKKVLLACRPGTDDMRGGEASAALELVNRDPELRQWWEQQQAFQRNMREAFRSAPVPSQLRERILAGRKIVPVSFWRRPAVLAAAAAVALFIAIGVLWQRPSRENSFAVFRSRMVGNVLRQYSMSIRTNDEIAIRQHLAETNAPADYVLPTKLAQLPLLGAGVLSWQDARVSMVCIDSKTKGILFLFIADTASVPGSPPLPSAATVKEIATVSWTERGRTYVLAGSGSKDWLESFL